MRAAPSAETPKDRHATLAALLWFAAGAAILHAAYFLWVGLSAPLLDLHSFRQSQTGLTAWWFAREGVKLAYETPILGYPWSIPFEFPLYQALVAGLAVLGLPIEVAGRLWSFGFFMACLWPLSLLARSLALPRYVLPLTVTLLCSSPLYIYWSRTVMIESCALFLALLWLALLVRFLTRRSPGGLLAIVVVGSLGMLVKATTFPAFGLLGALWVLARLLRRGAWRERSRLLIFGALSGLLPLAAGYGWTAYADGVKRLNPFGALQVSSLLTNWIYGRWSDVFDRHFLDFLLRVALDSVGSCWVIAVLAVLLALRYRVDRYLVFALATGLAFFAPFLVFTNLHLVHNYYQYANAILAIVAVAFALTSIVEAGRPIIAAMLLVLVLAGQAWFFHADFAPALEADRTGAGVYRIALEARRRIPESAGLLVIGQDFSPVLAFYSERKGLTLPDWAPLALIEEVLDDPRPFFGDRPLGGIAYCVNPASPLEKTGLLDGFLAGRTRLATAGGCTLLSASR